MLRRVGWAVIVGGTINVFKKRGCLVNNQPVYPAEPFVRIVFSINSGFGTTITTPSMVRSWKDEIKEQIDSIEFARGFEISDSKIQKLKDEIFGFGKDKREIEKRTDTYMAREHLWHWCDNQFKISGMLTRFSTGTDNRA